MYHIIVNPTSRSERGLDVWIQVKKKLLYKHVKFQSYITKYPGHAKEIAWKLTGEMWDTQDVLVIIGGDGTLNEVVNGIQRLSDVTLGYIPTGSGNDFARGLGTPTNPDECLNRILNPKRVLEIDIGRNFIDGKARRFTISSGIGYDAGICHEASYSRIKDILNRLKLGKLTYICIALRQLATFSPCTIEVLPENGQRMRFKKAFFAVAMNLPYEGGGCKFTPEATADDGLLDVMIVSGISKLKVLMIFPLAIKGYHTHLKEVHMIKCRSITIHTDKGMPVHLDGESGGYQKRMEVSLEKQKLKLLA